MLRQAGYNARVNFAAKKQKTDLLGHCWVDRDNSDFSEYRLIFAFP